MDLARVIRKVPDFPKPGILFYDISTILADAAAFHTAIDRLAELVRPFAPSTLAAIESRGFLFAAPLAYKLGIGLVMVRKIGKLPGAVVSHSYELEYGSDTLQIVDGVVERGARTVIIDDVLATGGTAAATVTLLQKVGAVVPGAVFLIELDGLPGRTRLGIECRSLLQMAG